MADSTTRRNLLVSGGALVAGLSASQGAAAAAAGSPSQVPYILPDLPYAYDALEPAISAAILQVHHGKHHAGYVKGLNDTVAALASAREAGDMSRIRALSRDLAFNGSGHVLHSLYWTSMKGGAPSTPAGALAESIRRDFGSLDKLGLQFKAAAKAVEASGWAVLAYEPLGARLVVLQAEKHQDLTIWGAVPLMVCDVWEHAYYLQYTNRRADYVEAFWGIVDWASVAARHDLASAAAKG